MELAIMNKSWHNNDNIMNSEAVSQPAPLYRRILWSMPFRVLFGLGVPAAALAGLWFLYRPRALKILSVNIRYLNTNRILRLDSTASKIGARQDFSRRLLRSTHKPKP